MKFQALGLAAVILALTGFSLLPAIHSQDIPLIVLSNIELVTVNEDSAIVTWVTNLPANTEIQWGETEDLGEESTVEESTLYHLGKITDLEVATEYFYRVGSNGRWSEIWSFTTLSKFDGDPRLTFAVVADTHYDVDGQNTPNGFMYGESTRLTESLVDELNQDARLDFVITAGDLTNVGLEEDYSGFADAMNQLDVPWYPVLGNHDKSVEDWYQHYTTYFGRKETYYSFDQGDYHFVVLDSAVQGQVKGDLNETQLAWLEADLDANTGKSTLIFLHHVNHRVDIMGLEEEAKENLELILSTRPWVLSVNSGHTHQNYVTNNDYSQVYATVAAVVSYPIGYSKINFYEAGYVQAFYKIETELETSEDSRMRINAASGSTSGDEEYLGELEDRSFIIAIPENQPPVISYLTADPGSITPGGTCTISVSAYDPDDDDLEYHYEVSDGYIEGSGERVTYNAPDYAGLVTIYVKVTDGEFTSLQKSIDIEVYIPAENHAPDLKDIWTSKSTVRTNELVEIRVTAVDVDEDNIKFHYESNGGTIIGSGDNVKWQAPDKAGKYTITVWVSDWELNSEKQTITIKVTEPDTTETGWMPGYELMTFLVGFLVIVYFLKRERN
jgi:predicted phosphodiesterase